MTPISTNDNAFAPGFAVTLTREDLSELTEKLLTAYLDSLYLLRQRSAESEDANNVEAKVNSLLYDCTLREMNETDIKVVANDIKASPVLRWFFSRMLTSYRSISVPAKSVDLYICNSLSFFPIIKMDNAYAGDNLLMQENQFLQTYDQFPFMKVLALFEMLNIMQEIEFRKVQDKEE